MAQFEALSKAEAAYQAAIKEKERELGGPVEVELQEDGSYLFKSFVDIEMKDGADEAMDVSGQMRKVRDDQVFNNAGGAVFEVSSTNRVRRFLVLGCDGPTYYVSEKQLAIENLSALIKIIIKGEGSLILREVLEISEAGRAPRQDPTLFSLALCARYCVHDATAKKEDELSKLFADYINQLHKAAFSIVSRVCRIPTHLFGFVKFCEVVSKSTGKGKGSTGWGRTMRDAISGWYLSQAPKKLAMQVTKYRQRDGWSHRDLFRLAHPTLKTKESEADFLERKQIYQFVVKGTVNPRKRRLTGNDLVEEAPEEKYSAVQLDSENNSAALDLIEAFLAIKELKEEKDVPLVVEAIRKKGLVREHIASELLNSKDIWKALLERMPMTAMVRNLGKMQSIEILNEETIPALVKKLTDVNELKAARIHPMQVLLASSVYNQGRGDKGSLTWRPDSAVSKALEDAFIKSFVNVEPTNKRYCLAFDVSGSMTCSIMNTALSCRDASAALGLVTLRTEPHTECVGFTNNLTELPYNASWGLQQIIQHMSRQSFSSTDCSLPMIWATKNKKEFDVFIVFTDCETYFGEMHPFEALRQYREASGIDARLVVVGMTATNFTIADPTDAGMLDVVGFDSAVPALISDFVKGFI